MVESALDFFGFSNSIIDIAGFLMIGGSYLLFISGLFYQFKWAKLAGVKLGDFTKSRQERLEDAEKVRKISRFDKRLRVRLIPVLISASIMLIGLFLYFYAAQIAMNSNM